MSKIKLAKKELIKGAMPTAIHHDKLDASTEHDSSLVSSEALDSVFSEFPFLKSEIEDVFGSVAIGSEWLKSQVPALGGLTPIKAIQSGDLKLVLDMLNKIKFGEYC